MADNDPSNPIPPDENNLASQGPIQDVDAMLGALDDAVADLSHEVLEQGDSKPADQPAAAPSAADPPSMDHQLDELEALLDEANQELGNHESGSEPEREVKRATTKPIAAEPATKGITFDASELMEGDSIPSLDEEEPIQTLADKAGESQGATPATTSHPDRRPADVSHDPQSEAHPLTASPEGTDGSAPIPAIIRTKPSWIQRFAERWYRPIDALVRLVEWCDRPLARIGETTRIWVGYVAVGTLLASVILWGAALPF